MSEENLQSGGRKALALDERSSTEERAPVRCGSGKDTHRWCKGRVGVEHELVWQHLFSGWDGGNWEYQVKKCVTCGRHDKLRVIRSDRPPSLQPEGGYDSRYRRQANTSSASPSTAPPTESSEPS